MCQHLCVNESCAIAEILAAKRPPILSLWNVCDLANIKIPMQASFSHYYNLLLSSLPFFRLKSHFPMSLLFAKSDESSVARVLVLSTLSSLLLMNFVNL